AIYRHGMASWVPIADSYDAVISTRSNSSRSPEMLMNAFDNLRKGMVQLGHQSYYANLAKAMVEIGEFDDAARVLDFVLRVGPQRWVIPELLRLQAAVDRSFGDDTGAIAILKMSLQRADEMDCPAWKLCSGIDLAAALVEQGERTAARQILQPIYDQFHEG